MYYNILEFTMIDDSLLYRILRCAISYYDKLLDYARLKCDKPS